MCCPRAARCLLLLILLVFICTMAGDTLHGTSTVRISRLVSFHTLILYTARNATRLTPGMAPVLIADAGILATSFMHTHKSAPIAALPRRVPHQLNCRPSALEVILPTDVLTCARLHTSCTPHRLHTVDSNGSRCPALAPARCTRAMKRLRVAPVIRQLTHKTTPCLEYRQIRLLAPSPPAVAPPR